MKHEYMYMGEVRDKIETASNKELNMNKERLNSKILKSNRACVLYSGLKTTSAFAFIAGSIFTFVANPLVGLGMQVAGAVGFVYAGERKRKTDKKIDNLYKVKDAVEEELDFRFQNQ